MRCPQEKYKL